VNPGIRTGGPGVAQDSDECRSEKKEGADAFLSLNQLGVTAGRGFVGARNGVVDLFLSAKIT